MKPGDMMQTAIWLSGKETREELDRWRDETLPQLWAKTEDVHGIVIGPVTLTEKRPGEDRAPPVPDHISGPDVRLLVGEAAVVGFAPQFSIPPGDFTGDLDRKDLGRLRKITRRAFIKSRKREPTVGEVDDIINRLGPDIAVATLRDGAAPH